MPVASSSFGIRVIVNDHWAAWKWAPGIKVRPGFDFDINWAEAIAVELGLRLAIHLWAANGLHNRQIITRSDNQGIVAVVNRGRSQSHKTNEVLKPIYMLLACHEVRIVVKHVIGQINIADTLSRGDVAAFRQAFPSAVQKPNLCLPPHLQDMLLSWPP